MSDECADEIGESVVAVVILDVVASDGQPIAVGRRKQIMLVLVSEGGPF